MPPENHIRSVAWSPFAICPHPDSLRRLQESLAALGLEPVEPVTEYPRNAAAALAVAGARNICFLDVAGDPPHAQALISELAAAMPVVALHPDKDADMILSCLRQGACEFLADPTPDALRALFERLGRIRSGTASPGAGEIYCVLPGKPGSGASTLAVHLAIQFRRSGAARVLLVDGDPLSAGVTFQLKLKPELPLAEMRRDWSCMDDELWARLTVPAHGVDVLVAPEDAAARVFTDREFSAELRTFWKSRYDIVVVDLPDVLAARENGLAGLAGTVLLVTGNELGALQACSRSLRCLDAGSDSAAGLRLILNRYAPATGLKREEVKTALSIEPFFSLCNDFDAIQAALLAGNPVSPGSRFGAGVHALCRKLRHQGDTPAKSGSWLGALLRRKPAVSQ